MSKVRPKLGCLAGVVSVCRLDMQSRAPVNGLWALRERNTGEMKYCQAVKSKRSLVQTKVICGRAKGDKCAVDRRQGSQ